MITQSMNYLCTLFAVSLSRYHCSIFAGFLRFSPSLLKVSLNPIELFALVLSVLIAILSICLVSVNRFPILRTRARRYCYFQFPILNVIAVAFGLVYDLICLVLRIKK